MDFRTLALLDIRSFRHFDISSTNFIRTFSLCLLTLPQRWRSKFSASIINFSNEEHFDRNPMIARIFPIPSVCIFFRMPPIFWREKNSQTDFFIGTKQFDLKTLLLFKSKNEFRYHRTIKSKGKYWKHFWGVNSKNLDSPKFENAPIC